jgi:Flp pilus assembly protein TadB
MEEEELIFMDEDGQFLKTAWSRGLDAAIGQADLPVTAAGFIRFGLLLTLVGFAITFVMTGGWLVSLFVAAGSLILYIYWLHWRRDEKRLEYEEALADMCDRISAGAMLTATLQGAMTHAADVSPEILKEDFNYIAGQLSQGASIRQAIDPIIHRRKSYALELIKETLEVWALRGAAISLQDVLHPLSQTIREISATRRRMVSELSGVRRQMMIVAIAPLFFVAILRVSSPALSNVYNSALGQIMQIVAYAISAVGFLLGQRLVMNVQKFLEIESE